MTTRLQTFAEDRAEILRLTRRGALAGAAALGLAGTARAQAKEVVLANFGGDAVKAMNEAFVVPYEKKTGGKMVIDGSGPSNGKIKTMVQARNVTWDVVDSGLGGTGELGPLGLLEEIDYSVVDKSKVTAGFAYKYGVCNYMFSTVQAWDSSKIKDKPTLADFFDFKKYPGKRLMRKDSQAMYELALMADGVPKDTLYPLDTARALKKIAAIKKDLLFWSSGAESQTMLRDGEVVMGWLWHTRANLLRRDTNKKITFSFDGGLLQPGLWVVPKGNPAGKQVMAAIASMQDPEGQVKLLASMGNGPANPAAASMVPAELKEVDPGAPANAAVQAKIDAEWYEKNYSRARQEFLDMIAS
ncbi:ABC transporter substrate-binding protein [Reyranella sp.]|uniref:ABC transporter substrate-binding protein n=1 Tax=Reyranella sp. TaxID=1929291 RepID=UPI0037848468